MGSNKLFFVIFEFEHLPESSKIHELYIAYAIENGATHEMHNNNPISGRTKLIKLNDYYFYY